MKLIALALAALSVLLLLASCDNSRPPSPQEIYSSGYRKGAEDAVRNMEEKATQLRSSIREELYPKLVIMSIIAVVVTLVGTEVAEQIRKEACDALKWKKQEQMAVAWLAYISACAFTVIYSLSFYGMEQSVPILILLGGTLPAFIQVIDGIDRKNVATRKAGVSKLKMLFFLMLVVVMVYRLLSDGGISGIKFG